MIKMIYTFISSRNFHPFCMSWGKRGVTTKKEFVAILIEKYMKNPPDGYTRREIEHMRDNDILDMDYFLNEF